MIHHDISINVLEAMIGEDMRREVIDYAEAKSVSLKEAIISLLFLGLSFDCSKPQARALTGIGADR